MQFELSEGDLMLIARYLGKQPFEEVAQTLLSLERQLQAHLANDKQRETDNA
jgi:hypothetical protein